MMYLLSPRLSDCLLDRTFHSAHDQRHVHQTIHNRLEALLGVLRQGAAANRLGTLPLVESHKQHVSLHRTSSQATLLHTFLFRPHQRWDSTRRRGVAKFEGSLGFFIIILLSFSPVNGTGKDCRQWRRTAFGSLSMLATSSPTETGSPLLILRSEICSIARNGLTELRFFRSVATTLLFSLRRKLALALPQSHCRACVSEEEVKMADSARSKSWWMPSHTRLLQKHPCQQTCMSTLVRKWKHVTRLPTRRR